MAYWILKMITVFKIGFYNWLVCFKTVCCSEKKDSPIHPTARLEGFSKGCI